MSEQQSIQSTVARRSVLRAGTVSLIGSTGCIGLARNRTSQSAPEQVSLTIKTTPADDDPYAIRIAQRLAANLEAVGIDVEVLPMRNDQLLKDVLVEQAFDLYVGVHGGGSDPDFLYPLVHSRFSAAPGWQNPFGYVDPSADDLLERQRRQTGNARRGTVSELQRILANQLPFAVVALPESISAVVSKRFEGWHPAAERSPVRYLSLRESDGIETRQLGRATTITTADDEQSTLRVALTDGRATENLNPIAVRFRNRGSVTDLLYDPLLLQYRGDPVPWLAASWRWTERGVRDGPIAVLRLREDLVWHDGRPISPADVAFTFRFIGDTSLGENDRPVPAPRFRGAESLVDRVVPLGERRVRIEFDSVHPNVALRALTVPVLPEHVWRQRNEPATVAGIDLFGGATEALVWNNMDPVGSGPLEFRRAEKDESLVLDRFEDHFVWREGAAGLPDRLSGDPPFDRIVFTIAPSDGSAIEMLGAGEIDATGTSVHALAVPRAVRADDVRLISRPSPSFYHVGFNTRRTPLSNPDFRRAVAKLIDKGNAVTEVFRGYASPATSPLAGSEWLAPELKWRGEDPVLPFAGNQGVLDGNRARQSFENAGFRYDDAGRLRVS